MPNSFEQISLLLFAKQISKANFVRQPTKYIIIINCKYMLYYYTECVNSKYDFFFCCMTFRQQYAMNKSPLKCKI